MARKDLYLKNDPTRKNLRCGLRQNQTDTERLLWSKLRRKQVAGVKFLRQYGIGKYIVEFCSPQKKLIVELDGGQHYEGEAIEYDLERTKFLESCGYRVVRFSNLDVLKNLEGVLEMIWKMIS